MIIMKDISWDKEEDKKREVKAIDSIITSKASRDISK